MQLFCGIPFIIVLFLFITSLRNKVFTDLSVLSRFLLTIASLIPIWGIVVSVLGIYFFFRDIESAGPNNRILNNIKINKWLFGEDKCFK